jgi:histidinol-phosphate aminotransferase
MEKLNRNEVSWNLLPLPMDGRSLNRYPELDQKRLKSRLAKWLDIDQELIVVTAGGDHLIDVFMQYCLINGYRRIGILYPSFETFFLAAKKYGLEIENLNLDKNFDIDTKGWKRQLEVIDSIVLCSPNNPTGNSLSTPKLENLLRQFTGPCLLDQAYLEFSARSKNLDLRSWVLSRNQTLVLRTFSKYFGLASLRIGYGLASPDLTSPLQKLVGPYPVATSSLACAEVVLGFEAELVKYSGELRKRVQTWTQILNQSGTQVKAYPSEANFILVEMIAENPPILADPEIEKRLRFFESEFGKRFARLTIDLDLYTPELNEKSGVSEVQP